MSWLYTTSHNWRRYIMLRHRINVGATSWRCIDVGATLSQRCVPSGNLTPNFALLMCFHSHQFPSEKIKRFLFFFSRLDTYTWDPLWETALRGNMNSKDPNLPTKPHNVTSFFFSVHSIQWFSEQPWKAQSDCADAQSDRTFVIRRLNLEI